MKLYEIKNAMVDTLDIFLESEETEMDLDNREYIMDYLKEELEGKSSNIIKYIKNIELEASIVKSEIDRLLELKKKRENKIDSLKGYLKNILITLDIKKIHTEIGDYALRKSSSIEILDVEKIPKKFLEIKKTIHPDKRAISSYLKNGGKNLKGAKLIETYNLQIG